MSEQGREQELPEEPARRQTETVDSLEERVRDDDATSAGEQVAGDDVVTDTDADDEQGDVSEPPG